MSQKAGDTVATMARMRGKALGISGVGFVLIGAAFWIRSVDKTSPAQVSQQRGTNASPEAVSQRGEAGEKQ